MGCKILLIDDNPDDLFIFKRILRKSGIDSDVLATTNAKEGLENMRHAQFDCVFLDYNLPGMSGIDFLKELSHEKMEVPVIMLTGQEDEQVTIELMKEGAIDYISKNHLNEDVLRISIQNARIVAEARLHKKQAEEALKISEARLAEAQKIAQVGNWEYNFHTQQVFLSAEARRILGFDPSKEDHLGFEFLRHVYQDDILQVLQTMKNRNAEGEQQVTFRLRVGNSFKFVHGKGYVVKDEATGIHISKGTIQDITVLKRAMQEIQKAMIGRKATTIVFGIAIVIFLVSEALLDPFVDGLHTSLMIGLSFKGGLALFLKPIETFLEKFMLSKVMVV